MTRYYKIAISLPSHAAEHVRDAVRKGHAPSASAYIARAIEGSRHPIQTISHVSIPSSS